MINFFCSELLLFMDVIPFNLMRVREKFSEMVNWASTHIDLMLIVYKKRTFNFILVLNQIFENKDLMDIILQSMMNPEDILVSKASLNKYSLLF